MATMMAADDDDNKVDGDGATGDDDGTGATGDDNDDDNYGNDDENKGDSGNEPTISQQVGEVRVRPWKREAAARRDKRHSASGEAVVAWMGRERVVGKWVSQSAATKERGGEASA